MSSSNRFARGPGRLALSLLLPLVLVAGLAEAAEPTFVRLETDSGAMLLVLYHDLAPHHAESFAHLARTGFYTGTRFHRIVPGFVIQGGDPNSKDADPRNDGMGGPTVRDVLSDKDQELLDQLNARLEAKGYKGMDGQASLRAEFSTARHVRGTLSMARSREPDSAGSQFFVCVDDTPQLNNEYTVFGHVVMGMEVADVIVNAEKNPAAGRDAPAVPVEIKRVTVMTGTGDLTASEKEAWEELAPDLQTQQK